MQQPAAPIQQPYTPPVQPQPVAPIQQPYVPPVQPVMEQPQYGGGGFLGKFDWVEIGILALGVFTMFHIIDFYRKKAKAEQANQATLTEVAAKVDQVQSNFDGLMRRLTRRRN